MVFDVAAVVVSVIVLTGVVLVIVAGLCTNSWCCQENIDTPSDESRIPVANDYVNINPSNAGKNINPPKAWKSEKRRKSGKNRFSRATTTCGNTDIDDDHVYEDVTTRRPSKKEAEPCRGYLSMEVLKITPNRDSDRARTCERPVKSVYISDINLQ
ncbi:uncharacterized protein [Haliotis cracherodii]|uniref:uncharacterized protein n=1 Tax=Haliotis cracherodii TaxID=6455 RepID=UPI0039ED5869